MSPPETPVADHTEEPQSDLWTSDSERGVGTSDPLPSGAEDPSPAEPVAEDAPEVTATPDRDAAGKFLPATEGIEKRERAKKPRSDPQARVEAATAKEAAAKEDARQAREEARLAREEADRLRAASQTAQPPRMPESRATGPGFPKFDAWQAANPSKDFDDYLDERTTHISQQQFAGWQAGERAARRLSTYNQRLAATPDLAPLMDAALPQLETSLHRVGLKQISPVMTEALLDSEHAPEIVRFLVTHPEDAAQLAVESQQIPVVAASVMRRHLESLVSTRAVVAPDSAPVVRPSAAKPPVNRVGGTATSTPASVDDLDFGPEYLRRANAEDRKRREGGQW